jgi:hypothetical protein
VGFDKAYVSRAPVARSSASTVEPSAAAPGGSIGERSDLADAVLQEVRRRSAPPSSIPRP